MKADTMYFGMLEFNKEELICFEEGLFGFENRKDFLPVPFEADDDTILCLQSIEDRDTSFIIMNPFRLSPDYNPKLKPEDYKRLGTSREEDLSYYVICVIRNTPEESTVNLKCPVVVNSVTRKAIQVILEDGNYRFVIPFLNFPEGRSDMLVLRRKKGEAIKIGDNITVTVSDIGQDCVQIAIDAPREISILRSELAEAAKVNQESAKVDRESIKNLKNMLKNQKDKTNT